jgi:hypothetical protein
MKTSRFILGAAVLGAVHALAFADDPTIADDTKFTSNLTRAEVRAQVVAARRSGELPAAGESYVFAPEAAPHEPRMRAEVRGEARAFARRHDIDPGYLPG